MAARRTWTPFGQTLLRHADTLLAAARRIVAEEQQMGTIPATRSEPSGDEGVYWLGPASAPVGFVTIVGSGDVVVWIDILWVAPAVRRQGAATALLDAVIRDYPGRPIQFGTNVNNEAMRALARRVGFVEVGVIMERR